MTDYERNVKEQEVLEKGLLQFRAFDKYVKNTLKNNQIIFGAAKNFNDPFDCTLPIDLEKASYEVILKFLKIANTKHLLSETEIGKKAKYYFAHKTSFEKTIRSIIYDSRRFSCFQIDTEDETHKDILFWANYADKQKGICMKFNGKIIDAKSYFGNKVKVLPIEYVDYKKEIPVFDYLDYRINLNENGYKHAKKLYGERGPNEYFIGIKSTKWEYENEVRFVYESVDSPFLEPYINIEFKPELLEKVYIGCNANEKEIMRIFNMPKYKHVNVFKMIRDDKKFKFNEEKLK